MPCREWGLVPFWRHGDKWEYRRKEPLMLLSYVNMKLRDNYGSLDRLCEELDVNEQEITDSLASVGYHYNKERNQFVSQG